MTTSGNVGGSFIEDLIESQIGVEAIGEAFPNKWVRPLATVGPTPAKAQWGGGQTHLLGKAPLGRPGG